MRWQSLISYHGWAAIGTLGRIVVGYFGTYVVIWATLRAFHEVEGWTFWEVTFVYSLSLLSYALSQTFLIVLWDMDEMVVRGDLDEHLVRPLNPLVMLMAKNLDVGYVSQIAVSCSAIAMSLGQLGIVWGAMDWMLVVLTVLGATLIQWGVSLAGASVAFWWTRSSNLAALLRWGSWQYVKYPITIYPKSVRAILTVVIPYAFVNYYPSLGLLRKVEFTSPERFYPLLTLIIGALLAFLGYQLWSAGLKRYSSAGS